MACRFSQNYQPFLIIILFQTFLFASALCSQTPMPIASIGFEGNKGISTLRLRDSLRRSLEGRIYIPEHLESDLQSIRRMYYDEGFLRAQVGPPRVEVQAIGSQKTARIEVPISEGSVYVFGTATIKNLRALQPIAFMQMCPLVQGEPYSRIKAAQWQARIEDSYRAIGYLKFQCAEQENLNDKNKAVDLVLDCTEGKPYSVGKIDISGDASINRFDFKKRLLLGEGGIFNPELLAYSIQFVNDLRIYRPITNADVEIRINEESFTVDIVWHLSLLK
jgi:outer membrane protein insertion porin family